jgi:hypothetical protein
MLFWFHGTFALPHTRRRLAFRAWAFGGGLAAVLCSATYFFSFFFNILFGIFCQSLAGLPPQYFCYFFDYST